MGAIFGQRATFAQVRGPDLELVVFGDEFYARYETLAGYTVVFDATKGCYCYAALLEGELVSTGTPATEKPPAGTRRHLRESAETRKARLSQGLSKRGYPRPSGDRTFGPNKGLLPGRRLSDGKVRGLTIIVEFQDVAAAVTADDVRAMLNDVGYSAHGNHGSVHDYFLTMSSGALDFTNDVIGPIKLSRNRQHYVDNLLVEEALRAAAALGVDMHKYDSRAEGEIDALSFLYAGSVQYVGELWPHNHFVNLTVDGVRANLYLITALGRKPADLVVGTFCHEAGHLLCRFPDLYDYGDRDDDSEQGAGLGNYCLMSAGNHMDGGRTPSAICAYLRDLVGWCPNCVDLQKQGPYTAKHGAYDTVFKFRTDKPNEYFLVENRLHAGYDAYLPSSGLAIYHCDTLGSNEWGSGTVKRHSQCGLLQADGHRDLETQIAGGDEGDLYPGKDGVILSHATIPASNCWDGSESGLVISNIRIEGEEISFRAGEAESGAEIREEAYPNLDIPDNDAAGASHTISVARAGSITDIELEIDVIHTHTGDLRVELLGPEGHRAILQNQEGGAAENLKVTYTAATAPGLSVFAGLQANGPWILRVSDLTGRDIGKLVRWALLLHIDASAPRTRTLNGTALCSEGDTDQGTIPGRRKSRREPAPGEDVGIHTATINLTDAGLMRDLRARVEIDGSPDALTVFLIAPTGQRILLHDRKGGKGDGIRATYSTLTTPALAALRGQPVKGTWTLETKGTECMTLRVFALAVSASAESI